LNIQYLAEASSYWNRQDNKKDSLVHPLLIHVLSARSCTSEMGTFAVVAADAAGV
jgi:hypothetical protein